MALLPTELQAYVQKEKAAESLFRGLQQPWKLCCEISASHTSHTSMPPYHCLKTFSNPAIPLLNHLQEANDLLMDNVAMLVLICLKLKISRGSQCHICVCLYCDALIPETTMNEFSNINIALFPKKSTFYEKIIIF